MSEDHWSDLFLVAFLSNTSIKPKRNTMHKLGVSSLSLELAPYLKSNDTPPEKSQDSRPVLNAFSRHSPLVAPTTIWIHTYKVLIFKFPHRAMRRLDKATILHKQPTRRVSSQKTHAALDEPRDQKLKRVFFLRINSGWGKKRWKRSNFKWIALWFLTPERVTKLIQPELWRWKKWQSDNQQTSFWVKLPQESRLSFQPAMIPLVSGVKQLWAQPETVFCGVLFNKKRFFEWYCDGIDLFFDFRTLIPRVSVSVELWNHVPHVEPLVLNNVALCRTKIQSTWSNLRKGFGASTRSTQNLVKSIGAYYWCLLMPIAIALLEFPLPTHTRFRGLTFNSTSSDNIKRKSCAKKSCYIWIYLDHLIQIRMPNPSVSPSFRAFNLKRNTQDHNSQHQKETHRMNLRKT